MFYKYTNLNTGGESVKSLFLFPKEKFLYMISSGVPVSEGIGQSLLRLV